ncbi:hypothetical protein B0H19DRAFT_1076920 [Mycena capillaripes]|nr:hypothetical protein B0H19DRAFT_1076920 [Mycena capillaripes]
MVILITVVCLSSQLFPLRVERSYSGVSWTQSISQYSREILTSCIEISGVEFALPDDALNAFTNTSWFLLTTIADAFIIFRTFVVWNRNWVVIILPTLLCVANLGSSIWLDVSLLQFNSDNESVFQNNVVKSTNAFIALTLCTNLICTGLISFHIFRVHRRVVGIAGGSSRLDSIKIISVIVESAKAAPARLWGKYDKSQWWRLGKAIWRTFVLTRDPEAALFSAILTAFLIESYKSLTGGSRHPYTGTDISGARRVGQQRKHNRFSSHSPFYVECHFRRMQRTMVHESGLQSRLCTRCDSRSAVPISRLPPQCRHALDISHPGAHFLIFILRPKAIPDERSGFLLLHAALFLVFCGLVAFLLVNIVMTVVAATILGIVAAAYATLSLLPLPYRTPVPGTFWRVLQVFRRIGRRRSGPTTTVALDSRSDPDSLETMVEAMPRNAMDNSDERSDRDYKALVWMVKSLTNDVKLEPFVEAIPDLLSLGVYREIQRANTGPKLFSHLRFSFNPYLNSAIAPYITTANALIALTRNGSPQLKQVSASFKKIEWKLPLFGILWDFSSDPQSILNLRSLIQIDGLLSDTPYHIGVQFLSRAAHLEYPPHRWDETLSNLELFRKEIPDSQLNISNASCTTL